MIEQKIKIILGDLAFQVAVLQHQLEEANKKIEELSVKDNTNTTS